MNPDLPLEFGNREAGKHYQPRPGSYAVIVGDAGNIAVMSTKHHGFCLPGGGADAGETPLAALKREVAEECGHEVASAESFGFAIECIYAPGEGYFAKECTFFRVKLGSLMTVDTEPDHTLVWLPIHEARQMLSHSSQRWAVSLV